MKDIIYLDTSFLNSFMAQTNHGLPTSHVKEFFEQDTKTSVDTTQQESSHDTSGKVATGGIQIPMLLLTPSGELTYKYMVKDKLDNSYSLSQIDAGKEIISKQLHDNALIDFENYLNESNLYCTEKNFNNSDLGKYIKITHKFDIFDLNYIQKTYDIDLITNLMLLFASAVPSNHGPGHHNKNKSGGNQKQKLNPEMEFGLKAFDILFKYLSNILPTGVCIKQGNFLTPLKTEYLRGNSSDLIFKYGTRSSLDITVVGKVTREFDKIDINMFDEDGELALASKGINDFIELFLQQIRLIKKGDIIVSPIAIYFE